SSLTFRASSAPSRRGRPIILAWRRAGAATAVKDGSVRSHGFAGLAAPNAPTRRPRLRTSVPFDEFSTFSGPVPGPVTLTPLVGQFPTSAAALAVADCRRDSIL